ncbi:hypothetical protein [Clostridium oryzae]|uniref:DUF3829 domain-containing protein n=1 Tax=Clostridium oryzae TaxID=1450648 RepID=A0A1V4INK5_9CLOT|nr:hypothetical protein [Clostridium oryzae]OPJ61414.1 hypothetical protein CLORY_22800 [Clostridium oryzae]
MRATGKNKSAKESKEKKKMNGFLKSILVIFSITALSILIFFSTYYLFIDTVQNSYENDMKDILSSINSENKRTSNLTDGNSIKTKLAKKELPKIISSLENTRDKFDKISSTDEFKVTHKLFSEGIDSNILMYRQIIAILENPNSADISKAVKSFTKAEDTTENRYSQYNLGGTSISLLEDSSDFLKAFEYYANQLVKIKNDSDIISSKVSDFTASTDKIISKFIKYKTNFSIQLADARSSSNFNGLIKTASDYKEQCDELEKQFLNISVPDNCAKVQKSLVDIFDSYDNYIDNFIFAVKDEKSRTENNNKKLSKKQISDIYFTSKNNYMDIDEKYSNFIKEYTNLKNSYSQ